MTAPFEATIRKLTQPINGQYPRPWMTDMPNPWEARVFIVGLNQATAYLEGSPDLHETFIHALFNRNGQNCRDFHCRMTGEQRSMTRRNIEALSDCLKAKNIDEILETNVVCYSTPRFKDLDLPEHVGGRKRGELIFRTLLEEIRPGILIVHGKRATKELGTHLGVVLPSIPEAIGEHPKVARVTYTRDKSYRPVVFVIRSLSPRQFNQWRNWIPEPLEKLASEVQGSIRPLQALRHE